MGCMGFTVCLGRVLWQPRDLYCRVVWYPKPLNPSVVVDGKVFVVATGSSQDILLRTSGFQKLSAKDLGESLATDIGPWC